MEGWRVGNEATIICLVIRGCGMRSTEYSVVLNNRSEDDALGDRQTGQPNRVGVQWRMGGWRGPQGSVVKQRPTG